MTKPQTDRLRHVQLLHRVYMGVLMLPSHNATDAKDTYDTLQLIARAMTEAAR